MEPTAEDMDPTAEEAMPLASIDLASFNLTSTSRSVSGAAAPETKLIIAGPKLTLGKIPRRGRTFSFDVTYSNTDAPPSVVRLPFGMRERRVRRDETHTGNNPGTKTDRIFVRVRADARSGELWVTTGSMGDPGWMEKTSAGWIDVMP